MCSKHIRGVREDGDETKDRIDGYKNVLIKGSDKKKKKREKGKKKK